MAKLNTRGTLTRARWDYFEHTNGWASVYGSVASGGFGAYYANNASGSMQVDIYNLTWFCSVASAWNVQIMPPPLILTPVTPADIEIHATQPDAGQPVGALGMFSAGASPFFIIQRASNLANTGIVMPVAGGPFVTLPPGWAIAVGGFSATGPIEMSMSVFFQEVLDNVPPAP